MEAEIDYSSDVDMPHTASAEELEDDELLASDSTSQSASSQHDSELETEESDRDTHDSSDDTFEHDFIVMMMIAMIASALAAFAAASFIKVRQPSHVRELSRDWIERRVPGYSEQQFRSHFRLSPQLTEWLTQALALPIMQALENQAQAGTGAGRRFALGPDIRIKIFLYYLAHGDTHEMIASRFGIGMSTVRRSILVVLEVFSTAAVHIDGLSISFPSMDEQVIIANGFEQVAGLKGVIGAIDGTHVKCSPRRYNTDRGLDVYMNRKGFKSVQATAIVDNRGCFRHLVVGYAGSVHDSRVLNASDIPDLVEHSFLPGSYLLADGGYPLYLWMITPFRQPRENQVLTERQRRFNLAHCRTRVIIEQMFGILKQMWGILTKSRGIDQVQMTLLIIICCRLHNLRLHTADISEEEQQERAHARARIEAQAVRGLHRDERYRAQDRVSNSVHAVRKRNALADQILAL